MFYGVEEISSTPFSKNITLLFKSDDNFNKFISISLLKHLLFYIMLVFYH